MSVISINRLPALAIAIAFLFKLLFVNVPILISSGGSSSQKVISGHFTSTLKKRKRSDEVIFSSPLQKNYPVELCEENNLEEESLSKFINPLFFAILFLWLRQVSIPVLTYRFFEIIKSKLFPRKYLALSTLRI